MDNKIGVIVDNFKLGLREGIVKAKEIGADGIQIYATGYEMDPDNISKEARKELLRFIKENGLVVSALCGDLGGYGLQVQEENVYKIEKTKKIFELALDLESKIITTHIGIVPSDESDNMYSILINACRKVGRISKEMGVCFAIETGPEPAQRLKQFLDNLGEEKIGVNFDPANMVMVTGDNPVEGVHILKDYIVHTHVKDGTKYKNINPKDLYGYPGYMPMSHSNIAEMITNGEFFREVNLGEGQVDFLNYFKALSEIGYKGFLTIEREIKGKSEKDIKNSVEFIKRLQKKLFQDISS